MSLQEIGILKDKPHLFERFLARFLPFDHVVVGYCWIIIILTINFARPIGDFVGLLAFHFGVIVLVLLLVRFANPETNRLIAFFRLLYPVILMTFFYQFSGWLVQVVIPDLYDSQVVLLELSVLGVNPTLWLDSRLTLAATEILSAGYFSYYLMLPGLSLVLFFGRRDGEIRRFMTATCVTFFVSYLMFIFYPVVGPRFHFQDLFQNRIVGVAFRPLVEFIIDNFAFRGGAMPSSHVAEAMVVLFFAVRNYGRKAYFLVPFVIALALGTVYGRFHYASDVVIGVLMAIVITRLTLRFYPTAKDFSRRWDLADFDKKRMYVSDTL